LCATAAQETTFGSVKLIDSPFAVKFDPTFGPNGPRRSPTRPATLQQAREANGGGPHGAGTN